MQLMMHQRCTCCLPSKGLATFASKIFLKIQSEMILSSKNCCELVRPIFIDQNIVLLGILLHVQCACWVFMKEIINPIIFLFMFYKPSFVCGIQKINVSMTTKSAFFFFLLKSIKNWLLRSKYNACALTEAPRWWTRGVTVSEEAKGKWGETGWFARRRVDENFESCKRASLLHCGLDTRINFTLHIFNFKVKTKQKFNMFSGGLGGMHFL